MLKTLFTILILFVCYSTIHAQIHDGYPVDSSILRFNTLSVSSYIPDTGTSPLWQIGRTYKTFFTNDSAGAVAIMTDTLHYYPANADNWFILKIRRECHLIIDLWHRYQTDSGKDGGFIEYSTDHGITWQNIKGSCNLDLTSSDNFGTRTSNFYSLHDTLPNGITAFTGNSGGQIYSRFQFDCPSPIEKTTSTACNISIDSIYIRFRFQSDSVVDTFAGWMIDSIKIENDGYPGLVNSLNKNSSLDIYPNPSYNETYTFPALEQMENYKVRIFNAIGTEVCNYPYNRELKLNGFRNGIYYYSVTDGLQYYSGKLLKY